MVPFLKGVTCRATASTASAPTRSRPTPQEATFLSDVLHDCKDVIVLQKSDKATINELVEKMEEITANAGETIVHQGDLIDSMYIVVEGELIRKKTELGNETPVIKLIGRGDQFGAVTLLGNTPQKTGVTANTNCRMFRLDRQSFDSVILANACSSVEALEDEEEEGEDGEGEVCTPGGLKEIFVVSDSTGESASSSVRAALRQFDYCFGTVCGQARSTVFRFVRRPEEAQKIAEQASKCNALVVHTVMDPKVYEALTKACTEKSVETCDLWGALLSMLEKKFGAKRSGVTGRKQSVSDEYMRIVRAIEYTRKVDDGILPHMWDEADIMLIGPSRAGKTPLAFYLAQRGFKVANYPLVPEEEPPPELFKIAQRKCIALMIQPERLQAIRTERMAQFGRSGTSYASLDNIRKEVRWIKNFYLRRGPAWPIIDSTNAGVTETAARIMEIFDRRKGDSIAASFESPLTE